MGTGNLIFEAYIIIFCIGWWISCLIMVNISRKIRIFEKEAPPELKTWPKLSIIITACNEAGTIRPAITTLLEQDYPDLEILLIDDRSTDGTGAIIDGIAEEDSRIKAVHIEKLPEGWIGKINALDTGTKIANGEWMLFTDADIHFRQGTLRKAVSLAEMDKTDHLALLPKPTADSFWFDVVIHAFGAMFLHGTGAVDVGRPGSKAFVGTGAFNLVRRTAFNKTEGFSWLKMEPIDDVGLGLMLVISGAKSSFAITTRDISLVWYPSIKAMFKGVEKNLFGAAANYSLIRMVIIVAFIWAFALAPFAALMFFNELPVFMLGIITYVLMAFGAFFVKAKFGQKFFPLFLAQFGLLIISIMLLRSGIICKLRGGIDWRGTRYKTEDLLAGQRLNMGTLRMKKSN